MDYLPQLSKSGILNFQDAIRYLEAEYGFDHYNYLEAGQVDPSHHFSLWCDAKGYTADMADPEGKRRGSSQIWFAEYAADPNGEDACPQVQNFWHWLLSFMNPGGGFNVPATFKMNIADVLANYDSTVAVENAARVANVVAGMESIMRILPPEFKKQAVRQVSSMDVKLPAYVRTILGYFQTEFGPKVKLGFPRERF